MPSPTIQYCRCGKLWRRSGTTSCTNHATPLRGIRRPIVSRSGTGLHVAPTDTVRICRASECSPVPHTPGHTPGEITTIFPSVTPLIRTSSAVARLMHTTRSKNGSVLRSIHWYHHRDQMTSSPHAVRVTFPLPTFFKNHPRGARDTSPKCTCPPRHTVIIPNTTARRTKTANNDRKAHNRAHSP